MSSGELPYTTYVGNRQCLWSPWCAPEIPNDIFITCENFYVLGQVIAKVTRIKPNTDNSLFRLKFGLPLFLLWGI